MNNTYSDIEFNKYVYTEDKDKLVSLRYIFITIISLIITSVMTCWLYKFINTDNTRIITYDMLLAVKNYNFDLQLMYKRTIIVRLVQIIGLFIISFSKWKNKLKWLLPIIVSAKMGFILTIFILEMHIYGLINFVIISFPHEVLYIIAIAYLVRNIVRSNSNMLKDISDVAINRITAIGYIKILSLWICGVLCEITVNLVLVQKCLIIPGFYK